MELMIDIETLDVGQRSVILSIGVLDFDDTNGPASNGWLIRPSVAEQQDNCRTISLGTIAFWCKQPAAAVDEAMVGEMQRKSIKDAVAELDEILVAYPSRIWARGDIFDIGNITTLYKTAGYKGVPWLYNAPRDLRTFLSEATQLGWLPPPADESIVPHTALGDCRMQVQQLLSARQFLRSAMHHALLGVLEERSSGC